VATGGLKALAVMGALIAAAFFICTLLLCSLIEGSPWCSWWPHLSLSHILQFMKSSGYWGIGISLGLMVVHSFVPFPAEFVAIANGMVFGSVWGTVITWAGAMLGACLAFGLVRRYGRPFVNRMLTRKKARVVDAWLARHGTETLLVSRFIPVISFNLINYAAGLTRISWWTFVWTTGAGILPMTVLMVVMGGKIHTLPWYLWALLLLAGLVLGLALHRLLGHKSSSRFFPLAFLLPFCYLPVDSSLFIF
jgi:uncharacterized membrane protein YdjX (TVP38/TMEM64 family)